MVEWLEGTMTHRIQLLLDKYNEELQQGDKVIFSEGNQEEGKKKRTERSSLVEVAKAIIKNATGSEEKKSWINLADLLPPLLE